MQVYYNIDEIPKLKKPIVTVGTFDGVHCGHQAIFHRMKMLSKQSQSKIVAITFEPHPKLALEPKNQEIKLINVPEKKIERLALMGIDYLLIINFTPEFSALTPENFIYQYLVKTLGIGTLVMGYDHHFGKSRSGDFKEIERLSTKYGFSVVEVGEVVFNDIAVSSTKIRKALKNGEIELANSYLGYYYSITGKVVHGNMVGRTLGFPTANIEISNHFKLITANGVYACFALVNNIWYQGMGNIGFRPTVSESPLTVEVNIFNFDKNLYGKIITIAFVKLLRNEIRFENLECLRQQLIKDKIQVQNILSTCEIPQ